MVQEALEKTSCGEISIQQLNRKGASKSWLKIKVNSARADAKFVLSRAKTDQLINGSANTANGRWSAYKLLKPGAWQLEYRSGKEVCNTTTLAEVTCLPGFEQTGDHCNPTPAANKDATDLNVILGGLVGAVTAACVAPLLFYMRRNPKKAMKAC